MTTSADETISLETHSLADFAKGGGRDVLAKCTRFASLVSDFNAREDARGQFRVELEGPLDHRVGRSRRGHRGAAGARLLRLERLPRAPARPACRRGRPSRARRGRLRDAERAAPRRHEQASARARGHCQRIRRPRGHRDLPLGIRRERRRAHRAPVARRFRRARSLRPRQHRRRLPLLGRDGASLCACRHDGARRRALARPADCLGKARRDRRALQHALDDRRRPYAAPRSATSTAHASCSTTRTASASSARRDAGPRSTGACRAAPTS